MSWFYGKPMNDMPFGHIDSRHCIVFFASHCDFRGGVNVVLPHYLKAEEVTPEMWMQATGELVGYHATNIHKELNGFLGYGGINYTIISKEEAMPLLEKYDLKSLM